jgi:hypothetical protein
LTLYTGIHIAALIAYVAATVAVLVYAIPKARAETDPAGRLASAGRAMRLYDPFSIAALGVLVMTGAFALTGIKDALRERFFEQVGAMLAWKLFFTFLLIIVAAYLAFGVGNRLVGAAAQPVPPDAAWVASALWRIQIVTAMVLVLCAIIVWVAMAM